MAWKELTTPTSSIISEFTKKDRFGRSQGHTNNVDSAYAINHSF
jgi:hypothetical protein